MLKLLALQRAKIVDQRREQRIRELEPKFQKYFEEEERIQPTTGFAKLQQVQRGLFTTNTDAVLISTDMPELVMLNIMRYLELFDDISFGATCKNLHQVYTKNYREENYLRIAYFFIKWVAEWKALLSIDIIQKNLCDSGNYEMLKNVAELLWVVHREIIRIGGSEYINCLILPKHADNKFDILFALAITPKKGYLKSLTTVMPYVNSRNDGYGLEVFKNYARYIVAGQPQFEIDEFIEENMQNEILYEVLACIVGELIVTNSFPPPGTENTVTKFYDIMVAKKHSIISSLPPWLLAMEVGANPGDSTLTANEIYGFQPPIIEHEKMFPHPPLPKRNVRDPNRIHFVMQDITTQQDKEGMQHAVMNFYIKECIILQVENLSCSLEAKDIISVIVDNKLLCVRFKKSDNDNNDDEKYYCLKTVTDVYGLLFRAAANGGIHQTFRAGSHARVSAWKSLASLVGVPFSDGIEAIEKVAVNCIYLYFCEHGLGVLRPDRKTVAVLAFTDTLPE